MRMKQQHMLIIIIIGILLLLPVIIRSSFLMHVLNLTLLYLIGASSFRTVMLSGQFSLAHGVFMGIGAYVSGCLSKWLGWSPWICFPIGAFFSCIVGIIIGFPFARLRTVYYAMVSLFFGMLIINVIKSFPTITGGESGLIGIPPLLGFSKVNYYYFFLLICGLSLFVLHRFEYSRIGLSWLAIAQSPLVAESVGINERFYRVFALAVGCFFAGLSGSLYAHYVLIVSPGTLGLMASLMFLLYAVVGGIRSFWGPVIGIVLLRTVPELLRVAGAFLPYISAVLLLIVAYAWKEGLIEVIERILKGFSKLKEEQEHAL